MYGLLACGPLIDTPISGVIIACSFKSQTIFSVHYKIIIIFVYNNVLF